MSAESPKVRAGRFGWLCASNNGDCLCDTLGVIQQRDFGASHGRIHTRPVPEADERFRCPRAGEGTSALTFTLARADART